MENEIKLSVPYFSQLQDVTLPAWKNKACTIVNLKMVLEYYKQQHPNKDIESPSINDLIAEGLALDGYTDAGWVHNIVVMLARNHGCHAYREEFRSKNPLVQRRLCEEGIEKLYYTLETSGPVIASVKGGFGTHTHSHTILLVGIGENGFYYHDPNTESADAGAYQFVSLDRFKDYWRNLAIFIY